MCNSSITVPPSFAVEWLTPLHSFWKISINPWWRWQWEFPKHLKSIPSWRGRISEKILHVYAVNASNSIKFSVVREHEILSTFVNYFRRWNMLTNIRARSLCTLIPCNLCKENEKSMTHSERDFETRNIRNGAILNSWPLSCAWRECGRNNMGSVIFARKRKGSPIGRSVSNRTYIAHTVLRTQTLIYYLWCSFS